MFLLHGDSKYFDVLERVVYNGLISGVSLKGDSFFYPNPLESEGNFSRKPWFGCACCPVNITRFLPSVPGYIYAVKDESLYINLFMSNEARIKMDRKEIRIVQKTDYPWDGNIAVQIFPQDEEEFNLMLRIPGWAKGEAFPTDLYHFSGESATKPKILVNGKDIPFEVQHGYASIRRIWKEGDEVVLQLPMEIMLVYANPLVKADSGLVAIQRGPVVFCAEQIDLQGQDPGRFIINDDTPLEFITAPELLTGIGIVHGAASISDPSADEKPVIMEGDFTAIPYFAWANRGKGKMRVWFPTQNDKSGLK
jgi:DUF1680 family protein